MSFIAPSYQTLCTIQPDHEELQPTGQGTQYQPPTLISVQAPFMHQKNIMSYVIPSYQTLNSINPNHIEIPPIEQCLQYGSLPPICPPLPTAPDAPYSLSRVDMMNVEQTGNWVSTLGRYLGWKEAEAYARKFRENGVTGISLSMLTPELLDIDLGVTNESHRMELFRNIQLLYPQNPTRVADSSSVLYSMNTTPTQAFESPVNNVSPPRAGYDCISILNCLVPPVYSDRSLSDTESESGYSHCNISTCSTDGGGPVYMDCTPTCDPGYMADASESVTPDRKRSYAEVLVGPSKDGLSMPGMKFRKSECVKNTENKDDVVMSEKQEETNRSSRRARYRKLIVTLRPDQMSQDDIAIRRRFAQFNFLVDSVDKLGNSDSSYLVVFLNGEKARDAFERAGDLGYELTRKWPDRPNPRRPIKYISMRELLIREGKAFSGEVVGKLAANEIVTVNQVKGRRARMIKVVDGEVKNIGWVSLTTNEGDPLLVQVSEFNEASYGCVKIDIKNTQDTEDSRVADRR